jgi:alkylhydroperoxidase family enzyme
MTIGRSVLAGFAFNFLVCGTLIAADENVSRLPAIEMPPTDPAVVEYFNSVRNRGGNLLNLHLTNAHAPKIGAAALGMSFAIRFDAASPRSLRELTILRTAQIMGSDYELRQHEPLAMACGYSRAQINSLPNWQASTLFPDKERALLSYVDQLIGQKGHVDDATFASLSRHFTPREIVELTFTGTMYMSTAAAVHALQIKVEQDESRRTAAGKC